MTEDDARKKWCPYVGFAAWTASGEGWLRSIIRRWRGEPERNMARCIASGCMAWREYEEMPEQGYCGLAGERNAP